MFDSTNSRIIIAVILAILIVVFIFIGYGCAPVDSEGNPIITSQNNIEDKEDTIRYEINFDSRSYTGNANIIVDHGDSATINDINGKSYQTAWENILLIDD